MTIVTVPEFPVPDWRAAPVSVTSIGNTETTIGTLDGANDAIMYVGPAPVTGNLEEFYFRTNTTAVTSGPLNFDGRIEQVGSAGRPNGSLLAANTNGAISVADTDDDVWKTCTLTSAAALVRGTPFSMVVKAPGSGTFSLTMAGKTLGNGGSIHPVHYPLVLIDANGDGTYDTAIGAATPSWAAKISGTIYTLYGLAPWDVISYVSFDSASSPNERAARKVLAAPVRACGVRAYVGDVAAGGNFTISLWPDSGSSQTDANALAQVFVDGDLMGGTTQDNWVFVYFAADVDLPAGTYWVGVRPETSNNISVGVLQTPAITGIENAAPGGSGFHAGTRVWTAGSAPAFTNATTSFMMCELICNGIDDGTGGGSGGVNRAILPAGLSAMG